MKLKPPSIQPRIQLGSIHMQVGEDVIDVQLPSHLETRFIPAADGVHDKINFSTDSLIFDEKTRTKDSTPPVTLAALREHHIRLVISLGICASINRETGDFRYKLNGLRVLTVIAPCELAEEIKMQLTSAIQSADIFGLTLIHTERYIVA